MAKNAASALEEDDLPAARTRKWTREAFKAALIRRYSPRVHMSLILSACGLGAMLASWSLLHLGVLSMLVRYPVAVTFAYGVFLLGVWTWLHLMGLADEANARKAKSSGSGIDIDIPSGGSGGGGGGGGGGGSGLGNLTRGGGGSFDGGGASAGWAGSTSSFMAAGLQQDAAAAPAHASSSVGHAAGGFLDGLDGDGVMLLLLAIALVGTIFIASGFLIWSAPDVLTEAAFGAALTGTLSRPSAAHADSGWVAGVVRKTWWPFAIVLVMATVFAGYAHAHFPGASTFRMAIAMAFGH